MVEKWFACAATLTGLPCPDACSQAKSPRRGEVKAQSTHSMIDIVTMNLLQKPFRLLPSGTRHNWAAKRANELLLKLQEALLAERQQSNQSDSSLGTLVKRVLSRNSGWYPLAKLKTQL